MNMTINKATKCRLYPNREQQTVINKTLGSCRFVYNKMLDRQIKMYKRRKDHLTYNEMQNLLPTMKQYLPWLKEVDSQALKYACRQLDTAYQKFFKGGAGFPKHKRCKDGQSYTTTNAKTIHVECIGKHKDRVKLPLVGWMKVRGPNLPEEYNITKATVSRDPDGKYYVSIAYKQETDIAPISINTDNAIGLDFREGDLYCDSNGASAGKPNNIMESMNRLKRSQYRLSRMIESHIIDYRIVGNKRFPVYDRKLSECRNIQKQRKRIARIHKHIANQRKDFLHKQSAEIANRYDVVCIEDLIMRDMLMAKNSDPSAIKRHNINRKVYDDGWYMFTKMLEYKCTWQGKTVIRVSRDFPSTQKCSHCGSVNPTPLDVNIKKWVCPSCGAFHNRDYNAAVNIRNEGLRILKILV